MATAAGRGGGYAGGSSGGRGGLFARKRGKLLKGDAEGQSGLRRAVGATDLMALGIGGTIGTGIFVIIGEAINLSGPAIILSFALAGITCVFSALSYSELAAAIPVSGSAYTYSYATLGELVAWVIGWDLIIEYGFSVSTIAVGWGGYLKDLLDSVFGLSLPTSITAPPGQGGVVNLFAAGLVIAAMFLLLAGVRESARTNTVLVVTKLTILAFFIVIGITHFTGHHFTPFAPHGTGGTVDAAALIFFAYIGFDAVSTTGEEAERPQRDLPIGIIGSLAVVTVVYILVAVAAIGLVPASTLAGADAPLTEAIRSGAGLGPWAGDIMSIGALVAITSVVLTIFYGQTRIFFSMCRDGLMPFGEKLSKLSPRKVPSRIILMFGVLIAIMAALIPLHELAELVNIGTLFAFLLVNIGVIVLRRTEPDMERPFRVPLVPLFPLIGAGLCIYLMTKLQGATWWRFGIWLVIGLVIYTLYGRFHSRVRGNEDALPSR
ncbi:MAG TPA: amino acid permease [Baekduia sp.]|uniref:amino acid permease n=1 Tax=Baekduia sp. TaxID=2600305 RepID=UPI002D7838A9|nr:amino acid permease [Baekduia sp.]HET6508609.1 amino acid permease [Baekduia sp.]